jgi:hypothetical protein
MGRAGQGRMSLPQTLLGVRQMAQVIFGVGDC